MTGKREVRERAAWMRGYRRVLEARDRRCPPDRLRELARDEVRPVRLWAARNPSTPTDALDFLARDADDNVRFNVLLNPHTPDSALRWLADQEDERYGSRHAPDRQRILHHPGASVELRDELVAAGFCDCPGWCARFNHSHFGSSPKLT
ncbi:hypothetical protein AB0G04_24110 [Actinoplanes sp. NPDC023801]|uniref:hypothetical protein n=1 Tax=Actinoplanes sp. NPDC023801 TaxID=3154595 RepID=UPI0033D773BD